MFWFNLIPSFEILIVLFYIILKYHSEKESIGFNRLPKRCMTHKNVGNPAPQNIVQILLHGIQNSLWSLLNKEPFLTQAELISLH